MNNSLNANRADLTESYRHTCAINVLAGNKFNGGWTAADHQLGIVEEEFNEMKRGIEGRDLHDFRDGLSDLLFTVIGMAHRVGLPLADDLAEVVRSNMSKFDISVGDALLTREKYQALHIDTEYVLSHFDDNSSTRYLYVTRSSVNQFVEGKNYPKGKWLKSYRFSDTHFTKLDPSNGLTNPLDHHESVAMVKETLVSDTGNDTAVEPTAISPHPAQITISPHPAQILCTLLGRHVYAAHAYVGLLRDAARVYLTERDLFDEATTFKVALTGAKQFYHLLTVGGNSVEINDVQVPPAGDGWDSVLKLLSPSEAAVLSNAIAGLTSNLKSDDMFLYGWHANAAMAYLDAAVWEKAVALDGALGIDANTREALGSATTMAMFGLSIVDISQRINSQHMTNAAAAIPNNGM